MTQNQGDRSPGKQGKVGGGGAIFLMKKSGKFMKNCQSQGKIKFVSVNVLENVDVAQFISIFCQRIIIICGIFATLLTKWDQGKAS